MSLQVSTTISQMISIDDFKKLDLRIGAVTAAYDVLESDRLFRLEIDIGEGAPRQIVAGIKRHVDVAELIGKQVVIVANLLPKEVFGILSQGMLLAAGDSETLSLLVPEKRIVPGTKIR